MSTQLSLFCWVYLSGGLRSHVTWSRLVSKAPELSEFVNSSPMIYLHRNHVCGKYITRWQLGLSKLFHLSFSHHCPGWVFYEPATYSPFLCCFAPFSLRCSSIVSMLWPWGEEDFSLFLHDCLSFRSSPEGSYVRFHCFTWSVPVCLFVCMVIGLCWCHWSGTMYSMSI